MSVTISGYSDDIISLEGEVYDEIDWYDRGPARLTFTDGSIIEITYNVDGLWKATAVKVAEPSFVTYEFVAVDPDDDEYSDRLTLTASEPLGLVQVEGL